MKWLALAGLNELKIGWIEIFDENDSLCQKCSYPLDSGGCWSCNIFNKNFRNKEEKIYFDKNISMGEYYEKEDWENSSEPKFNLSRLILEAKKNKDAVIYCALIIKYSLPKFFPEIINNQSDYVICAVPDYEDGFQKGLFLAQELGRFININWIDVITKTKDIKPQHNISEYTQRWNNVKGVFEIKKWKESLIQNKNIILVDDVMTSGATQSYCSQELKKAGAKKVISVTLGRNILPPKEEGSWKWIYTSLF
jgi:ComF family protein